MRTENFQRFAAHETLSNVSSLQSSHKMPVVGSAVLVPALTQNELVRPRVVAVTGVTGYVAGPIVQRLLAAGHTVHGTCRAPSRADTVAHLTVLPGAAERLKLFKADLLEPHSFDAAFEGAEVVIHTASPYILKVRPKDVQAKLLTPAVEGTVNVLASVDRALSVVKVVLTSSCAAVYGNPHERGSEHVFTEQDWNLTASETVLPYFYSKTLAEQKAWSIAKAQHRWQLVTILPCGVYGPPMSARVDGESVDLARRMANNEMSWACPKLGFGYSDVRDVALAHTLAAFCSQAHGRYIATSSSEWIYHVVRRLSQQFPGQIKAPGLPPPKWFALMIGSCVGLAPDFVATNYSRLPLFDNSKIIKELGMTFLPRENIFRDQITAMMALGIIKPF